MAFVIGNDCVSCGTCKENCPAEAVFEGDGKFEIDPETITAETNIVDDLGADSLDVVELIMSLEDSFGITINDDDAAQLSTVGAIVDYLAKPR